MQVVSEQHSCELAVEEAEELKRFAHYLDLLFSVVGKCLLSKITLIIAGPGGVFGTKIFSAWFFYGF